MATARVWNKITITFRDDAGEREIVGSWSASNGIVTVKTPHGEKSTKIGQSGPELLARIKLRELATEGKA